MSKICVEYGNDCDVWAIISAYLQNQVPGLVSRTSNKAHNRAMRFFYALRTVTSQWWAEWGLLRKRRGLRYLTGRPTLFSSPPQLGLCSGDPLTKGAHS